MIRPITNASPLIKLLKIFILGSFVLFAVTGGCMIYWTVTNAFNAKRITDAQVKVYQAQADNVGKPIIYEQYYHSPNK